MTGSGKRDIFAQTMIFQYKLCCSKKRNTVKAFILAGLKFGGFEI